MFPGYWCRVLVAVALGPGGLLSMAGSAEAGPSFGNEVMAVLSKAGCNAGGCHGNASGKGGFKLSLRGEDPETDYLAMTRDVAGRRINLTVPEDSLILLKATTRVAHEGGRRFEESSLEYRLLREWLVSGASSDPKEGPRLVSLEVAPREQVVTEPTVRASLSVRGKFSDGQERNVTRLSVFEPSRAGVVVSADGEVRAETPGEVTVLVRYLGEQVPTRLAFVPARPEFTWPEFRARNFVDEEVFRKLRLLRIRPSPRVDDRRFLRRACLDLLGILPSAQEVLAFEADPAADKRERWVEGLLKRPEFADFWALKWSDLLRNEERALDRKGVELFHGWIRDGIEAGKPLDQFVRELITARGSTYENPAANFYRGLRDTSSRAETVAQVFLGTRLLCAQCHNHPYDRWTQADYHDWSGLFARVRYKVLENRYPDNLDKHAFVGEQIVYRAREGEAKHPRTGRIAMARFLGVTQPVDESGGRDRMELLATWLTAGENPRFARSLVNRIWYHLMGRGLVDPVDDFRATNPASHPQLLDALTADFVGGGFDLRRVIRTLMASHAYQADSIPDPTAVEDESNYSHATLRRLGAEQMLDALGQVAGVTVSFQGYPEGKRAGQIPGVQAVSVRRGGQGSGERFLKVFGKPERLLASEEERSCQTTLGQAFQLMTGPVIQDLLKRPGNRIDRMLAEKRSPAEMLDELYLVALTRPPREEERRELQRHIEGGTDRRATLEDVMWALMNAKEFVLRP